MRPRISKQDEDSQIRFTLICHGYGREWVRELAKWRTWLMLQHSLGTSSESLEYG